MPENETDAVAIDLTGLLPASRRAIENFNYNRENHQFGRIIIETHDGKIEAAFAEGRYFRTETPRR